MGEPPGENEDEPPVEKEEDCNEAALEKPSGKAASSVDSSVETDAAASPETAAAASPETAAPVLKSARTSTEVGREVIQPSSTPTSDEEDEKEEACPTGGDAMMRSASDGEESSADEGDASDYCPSANEAMRSASDGEESSADEGDASGGTEVATINDQEAPTPDASAPETARASLCVPVVENSVATDPKLERARAVKARSTWAEGKSFLREGAADLALTIRNVSHRQRQICHLKQKHVTEPHFGLDLLLDGTITFIATVTLMDGKVSTSVCGDKIDRGVVGLVIHNGYMIIVTTEDDTSTERPVLTACTVSMTLYNGDWKLLDLLCGELSHTLLHDDLMQCVADTLRPSRRVRVMQSAANEFGRMELAWRPHFPKAGATSSVYALLYDNDIFEPWLDVVAVQVRGTNKNGFKIAIYLRYVFDPALFQLQYLDYGKVGCDVVVVEDATLRGLITAALRIANNTHGSTDEKLDALAGANKNLQETFHALAGMNTRWNPCLDPTELRAIDACRVKFLDPFLDLRTPGAGGPLQLGLTVKEEACLRTVAERLEATKRRKKARTQWLALLNSHERPKEDRDQALSALNISSRSCSFGPMGCVFAEDNNNTNPSQLPCPATLRVTSSGVAIKCLRPTHRDCSTAHGDGTTVACPYCTQGTVTRIKLRPARTSPVKKKRLPRPACPSASASASSGPKAGTRLKKMNATISKGAVASRAALSAIAKDASGKGHRFGFDKVQGTGAEAAALVFDGRSTATGASSAETPVEEYTPWWYDLLGELYLLWQAWPDGRDEAPVYTKWGPVSASIELQDTKQRFGRWIFKKQGDEKTTVTLEYSNMKHYYPENETDTEEDTEKATNTLCSWVCSASHDQTAADVKCGRAPSLLDKAYKEANPGGAGVYMAASESGIGSAREEVKALYKAARTKLKEKKRMTATAARAAKARAKIKPKAKAGKEEASDNEKDSLQSLSATKPKHKPKHSGKLSTGALCPSRSASSGTKRKLSGTKPKPSATKPKHKPRAKKDTDEETETEAKAEFYFSSSNETTNPSTIPSSYFDQRCRGRIGCPCDFGHLIVPGASNAVVVGVYAHTLAIAETSLTPTQAEELYAVLQAGVLRRKRSADAKAAKDDVKRKRGRRRK
jgi:hypothetical protein